MCGSKLKFEDIRELADSAGREHWKAFIATDVPAIIDECINVRRAWMFFRNPAIEIPKEASLRKCALVISDLGEVRFTADYYPDLNECRAYLEKMADHFDERDL
jgi:hypothetical protein